MGSEDDCNHLSQLAGCLQWDVAAPLIRRRVTLLPLYLAGLWLVFIEECGRNDDVWLLKLGFLTSYSFCFHTFGMLLPGLLSSDCHATKRTQLNVWKCYAWERPSSLVEKLCQAQFPADLLLSSSHEWLQVRPQGEPCYQPTVSK